MGANRRLRYLFFGIFLYLAFCAVGGIYLADGTLHPARRLLTENEIAEARQAAQSLDSEIEDVSITTADGAVLDRKSVV
jgi:hypothetical protein